MDDLLQGLFIYLLLEQHINFALMCVLKTHTSAVSSPDEPSDSCSPSYHLPAISPGIPRKDHWPISPRAMRENNTF